MFGRKVWNVFPFSVLLNQTYEVTPPDPNWSLWNGSGDMPYSSLGTASNIITYSQTISIAKIDATRFLLISGGYTDPNLDTYINATVRVGTLTGKLPTYGTPVILDADAFELNAGDFRYQAAYKSDGKVYIYYSFYNGSAQETYAKICNVNVSNEISFGTRSVQMGVSGPSNSAVPIDMTLNPSYVYHAYRESANGRLFIIGTTINIDDTITVGTPRDMGQVANSVRISTFTDQVIFFSNLAVAYVAPSAGLVIGNVAASLLIDASGGSNAIARLNDTKILFSYQATGGDKAVVVTYNPSGQSLSKGTPVVFDSLGGDPIQAIAIGNNVNQVIVNYFKSSLDQFVYGANAVCLTINGTTITSSTPIPINANLSNPDYGYTNFTQSALISQTLIVSPYTSYNNTDFGLTVLNFENAFEFPQLIYRLKASEGLTTSQIGLADVTGTMGATVLTVVGDFTNLFVVGLLFYENSNPAQSHIVTSSSFLAGTTTVNFTTPLYNNLIAGLVYGLAISSVVTSDGFYTLTFTSAPISGSEPPLVGELNGQRTIMALNIDGVSSIRSNAIAPNTELSPVSVLGTDFVLFIVSNMVSGQVFDVTTDAKVYPGLSIKNADALGTTDIFPTYSDPISLEYGQVGGLSVMTVVRKSGASVVYFNGSTVSLSNAVILALGSAMVHYLFNNVAGTNAGIGAISDVQFWAGTMTTQQRQAVEQALITEYSIT